LETLEKKDFNKDIPKEKIPTIIDFKTESDFDNFAKKVKKYEKDFLGLKSKIQLIKKKNILLKDFILEIFEDPKFLINSKIEIDLNNCEKFLEDLDVKKYTKKEADLISLKIISLIIHFKNDIKIFNDIDEIIDLTLNSDLNNKFLELQNDYNFLIENYQVKKIISDFTEISEMFNKLPFFSEDKIRIEKLVNCGNFENKEYSNSIKEGLESIKFRYLDFKNKKEEIENRILKIN